MHQPHDKTVKRILSRPDTARDILSLYLPGEIISMVDLNKLELQPDSFIDDEHRLNAVDLLYKTNINNQDGYIWILLEHQRKSDKWMPVRIFKYISLIWDHIRKNSPGAKGIPLIFPVVLYNGERPYHHSLNLSELILPEESREIFSRLFSTPFYLIDLNTISDQALKAAAQERVKGIALLMALKHAFGKNLDAFLMDDLFWELKRIDRPGDRDIVVDILSYMLETGEFKNKEEVLIALHQNFSEEVEDGIMTINEWLIDKGRKEGMEEGMEKGMEKGREEGFEKGIAKVARNLLDGGLNLKGLELIERVHQLTGLSIEKIKTLATNN